MAPDWSSHFDAVYMLGYTGYKERIPAVMDECRRVGLHSSIVWQFPTPYDEVVRRQVKHHRSPGFFNSLMGHYRAVKTAYHLGAGTCLVLEDDIRFLKDVGRISGALELMPPDWDVVLFDISRSARDPWYNFLDLRSVRMVNPVWCRVGPHPRSFGCYGLTRRSMEHFIEAFEAPALSGDVELLNADEYLDSAVARGLNVYFPCPHVCVQRIDVDAPCNSFKSPSSRYDYYWHLVCNGIDLSWYNIEDVELVDELVGVARRTRCFNGGSSDPW